MFNDVPLASAAVWGKQGEVLHVERGVRDDWPSWTGIQKVRATAWHDVQHCLPYVGPHHVTEESKQSTHTVLDFLLVLAHRMETSDLSESCYAKWPGCSVFLVTQLKEVVLKSGKVLRADVCVIGAGDGKCSLNNFLYFYQADVVILLSRFWSIMYK